MKKYILLLVIFLSVLKGYSQFVQAIGITGGVTYSNQRFTIFNPLLVDKKKYLLGYNGSLFLENFNSEYIRWVTEIQYNEKGSIDKTSAGSLKNKLQYGCWNNYLKLRYEMYRIIPYIMAGVRVEYKLAQKTESLPATDNFFPLHLSTAMGAGVEFVSFGNLKFFIESFFNPDLGNAYENTSLGVHNKAFELRIGLKLQRSSRARCNMPRA